MGDGDGGRAGANAADAPAGEPKDGGRIPRKNGIRARMAAARDEALGGDGRKRGRASAGGNGDAEGGGADGSDEGRRNDDDGDDDEGEVSLEALKRKILGRSVSSMYDHLDDRPEAAPGRSPGPVADGTAAAVHLRQDLTCPICHDRMYEPASLLCGHSFCRACLGWWLDQRRGDGADADSDEEGGAADASNDGCGTCPSCREPLPRAPTGGRPEIRINVALKAVLDVLYGSEMNQRRLAEERQERKARSGEAEGLHARGHEELAPLPEEDELGPLLVGNSEDRGGRNDDDDEENGWTWLRSSSDRPGWEGGAYNHARASNRTSVSVRRNIVLDDTDQRHQLSLGLTRCSYSRGSAGRGPDGGGGPATDGAGAVLDVELCLLAMEEDEADDSGFPAFVHQGGDDEALICTGDDRINTCIHSNVRVVPMSAILDGRDEKESTAFGAAKGRGASRVREVPLSRGMIGRDGAVRFRIDLKKALDGAASNGGGGDASNEEGGDASNEEGGAALRVVKLVFRHADTGAVLELRLPPEGADDVPRGGGGDAEVEFGGAGKPAAARDDASRYLLDDHVSDDEHDGLDDYEEDGFLVNESHFSEGETDSGGDEDEAADRPQFSEEEMDTLGEEEGEEEEEDGVCQICNNGGDLIVCDGGDHEGGCGDAYHVHCIGRSAIPPGESSTIRRVRVRYVRRRSQSFSSPSPDPRPNATKPQETGYARPAPTPPGWTSKSRGTSGGPRGGRESARRPRGRGSRPSRIPTTTRWRRPERGRGARGKCRSSSRATAVRTPRTGARARRRRANDFGPESAPPSGMH